ncbi:hypothetical protein [Rufibacter sp. LB8]|uniref:tetratricopeptide repeat protein n=1 Tax=Rufibacter sp. LB8 TaxID=2777781 RepID=UPI00178C51EB|nr:hypothetical protein [Rufibacter sp. LB8]
MALLTFWQALEPARRALYLFLFALVLSAMGLAIYGYFAGNQLVFPLVKQAELFPAEAHLSPSSPLLVPVRTEVNAYLISEQYALGNMHLPAWATWAYAMGLAIALVIFWTVASTLQRIPYYVAVALGMLWLSTFNLDLLGNFSGNSRLLLVLVLAILGGGSFLFQAFWTRATFLIRLLFFTVAVALLSGLLIYLSPLAPFLTALHVVNYSTVGSLIASFLFMVLVAYENLHGLLWFNTQAQTPARRFGLWQYILISVLYLGNLLILYLQQTGLLQIDYTGIDALLILLASALVGFWGLRQREVQYASFLSFATHAAPLYFLFALLTFLNLGYALLMANDPIMSAYRSAVILSHLALGVAFFLYVLANYAHLMKQKLRVFKVVYDPRRLSFFTVYLMGVVLLGIMVVRSNYSLYFQGMAGYYNYLGDLYQQTEEEPLLAEQFYLEGSIQARNNLRSSLSLADMYHQAGMRTLEINRLRDILSRKPSAEASLRLASLYTGQQDLFEQLKVLQEGTRNFPDHAPLLNNLGLVFGTTTLVDSAAHYLEKALQHSAEPEVIQANQLTFLFQRSYLKQAKEFAEQYKSGTYGPLVCNRLALSWIMGSAVPTQLPSAGPDSILTSQEFAGFWVRALHPRVPKDTTVLSQISKYLRQEQNHNFADDLTLAQALVLQRQNKATFAKATLEQLAESSEAGAGYYYDILGQWMLQNKLYSLAATYFQSALNKGYRDAQLHGVVALALAGETNQAVQLALGSNQYPEPWQQKAATQLAIASQMSPEQAVAAPDSIKIPFLQLRSGTLPVKQMEEVAAQITTSALAPVAALPLIDRYLKENNLIAAHNLLQAHFPASFPKNNLKSEANLLQAELWWKAQQWPDIEKQVPKLYFAPKDAGAALYYQALLAQRNKQTAKATNLFEALVQRAPWSETGQLAAANFFTSHEKPLRAYDLLLEAISYNPSSVPLRKAFVRVALGQGLREYALQGLEELERLLPPAEMLAFKNEIDAQLRASEALRQDWQ